jgi:hypothetical protein
MRYIHGPATTTSFGLHDYTRLRSPLEFANFRTLVFGNIIFDSLQQKSQYPHKKIFFVTHDLSVFIHFFSIKKFNIEMTEAAHAIVPPPKKKNANN